MKQNLKSKPLDELAKEYYQNYLKCEKQIKKLKEKLKNASGEEIYILTKQIKIYNDMALECLDIANTLKEYYNDEKPLIN